MVSHFFFASKCFIPRREIRSISLGVQLILFPFIGVSKSLEPFKNLLGFQFFFLGMFYHPEVGPIKDPYGFPIWDLSVLYLSRELFFYFKITVLGWLFLIQKKHKCDGSVGRWVGRTFIFLFCFFFENYLVYHANYYWSP